MNIKFCIEDDFVNYKKPNMFIGMPNCSGKCDIDNGTTICQNSDLRNQKSIDIPMENLIQKYLENDITEAIVFGGLEPFDSAFDLSTFIYTLRNKYNCKDDVVIFTGYDKEELLGINHKNYDEVNFEKLHAVYKQICSYENIIIKYGRYIPNNEKHFDDVLGIYLSSDNQYAEKIN